MRTVIPDNKINNNYTGILNEFIFLLKEKQGENLLSVYLSGSYARGDANENSDMDLFCIFGKINSDVLRDVGFCARHTSVDYDRLEINSQCMSLDEFTSAEFENWSEHSVRALDSVLLYGKNMCGELPDKNKISAIYKKYLAEIIMSIRHYISVDEPPEKLSHEKIKRYILKPLTFALRLECYCRAGIFPVSEKELFENCSDDKKFLLEYYSDKEKFDNDILEDHRKVLAKIHSAVCAFL